MKPPRERPIGRDEDAVAVGALLLDPTTVCVTLTGPGGVGKTTLARFVGAEVAPEFRDGVHFVDLTVLGTGTRSRSGGEGEIGAEDAVAGLIADCVGLVAVSVNPRIGLAEHFADRSALLVLDNFEHVVDAAGLVAALADACLGLRILVTSREALRLHGERRYPLSPLALPTSEHLVDTRRLAGVPGVDLFVRRARAVVPDFELRADNAADVAGIVAGLDGLPLAIELAAARVRLFSAAAIRERIEASPLGLLTGGARDLPARQKTIDAAIAWSYTLLPREEQQIFRCLGVFADGFDAGAVEVVLSAVRALEKEAVGAADRGEPTEQADQTDPPDRTEPSMTDVLDALESLLDKSLIQRRPSEAGPSFGLLETVRAFARARLVETGALETARVAHVAHYRALAVEAAAGLRTPESPAWIARFSEAHENLCTALAWVIDGESDDERVEQALRLVAGLTQYWMYAHRIREGVAWIERALPVAEAYEARLTAGADVRGASELGRARGTAASTREEGVPGAACSGRLEALARFWHAAGTMFWFQGDDRRSAAMQERAMAAFAAAGYERGMAMARHDLASRLSALGQHEDALGLLASNVAFYERLGIDRLLSNTMGLIGLVQNRLGDSVAARAALERSLEGARRAGHAYLVAINLGNLAYAELELGDFAAAEAHLREALALSRERFPGLLSDQLNTFGRLRELQDAAQEALAYSRAALRASEETADRAVVAGSLLQAGFAHARLGAPERGARLLGAAMVLGERAGRSERTDAYYRAGVARLREALGEAAFDAAVQAGRALSREQAVALAGGEGAAVIGTEKRIDVEPPDAGAIDRETAGPPEPAVGTATGAGTRTGTGTRTEGPTAVPERAGVSGLGAAPSGPAARSADPLAGLTRREREVATLMARGLTNDEIAAELVIAGKTVEMHASRVLHKLGFRNRVELAAWAASVGLLS